MTEKSISSFKHTFREEEIRYLSSVFFDEECLFDISFSYPEIVAFIKKYRIFNNNYHRECPKLTKWLAKVVPSCIYPVSTSHYIRICDFCQAILSSQVLLIRHYREIHYTLIPEGIFGWLGDFYCKTCDQRFVRKEHLTSHLVTIKHLEKLAKSDCVDSSKKRPRYVIDEDSSCDESFREAKSNKLEDLFEFEDTFKVADNELQKIGLNSSISTADLNELNDSFANSLNHSQVWSSISSSCPRVLDSCIKIDSEISELLIEVIDQVCISCEPSLLVNEVHYNPFSSNMGKSLSYNSIDSLVLTF